MQQLFSRLVCCGPGAENNVHYSDEDDSSSDEFSGGGAASAAVIRWPHDTPRRVEDAGSVRVLPSDVKAPAERSRHHRHRKSESVANFVPHEQQQEQQKPGGAGAKGVEEAGARWPGKQSSLVRESTCLIMGIENRERLCERPTNQKIT